MSNNTSTTTNTASTISTINTTHTFTSILEKPNHVIDIELKELLHSFEPSFLGTWLYTPCDCLFPTLDDHINGLIQVAISYFHLHEFNNPKLSVGAVWGSHIYTDDSDIVTMLYHSGYLPKIQDSPPPPLDVLVQLRVYPKLVTYPSTFFNGILSRSWTEHDGVSLCIENVYFVPIGTAIKKASRRLRKAMLDYRLKGYQYTIHRRKRLTSLDDATFVYDTSGRRRMVYSSQLAPFLENRSFVLEAKDHPKNKMFLISPNPPSPSSHHHFTTSGTTTFTTYSLTELLNDTPSFVFLTSFVWSDITFHSHGILIMVSSSSSSSSTSSSSSSSFVEKLLTTPTPTPTPTATATTTTTTPSPTSSSSYFKKPIVLHVDWVWLHDPTSLSSNQTNQY